MKFIITLKDPDGFSDSVKRAVDESCSSILDLEEMEAVREIRTDKVWDFLDDFVNYQEYVYLEVDTEAKTFKVMKCR